MKKIFFALILSLVSVLAYAGESILGYLDGKPITYSDIKSYVELLPGDKYRKMLETKEGLKKLLNYYIDRRILLEEAKKEISPEEGVLRSHSAMDEDAAYIIAFLTKKINNNIKLSDEEIKTYARKKGISERKAYAELLSKKRRELYEKLINNLRKKHKIEILLQ